MKKGPSRIIFKLSQGKFELRNCTNLKGIEINGCLSKKGKPKIRRH